MSTMRLGLIAAALLAASGATAAPTLEQAFTAPDSAARPRVWWHWIDGNVTREGITRDLEWMQRNGIAGFQLFDIGRGYPAYVDKTVEFMSPEWKRMVRHAASEADRLGLEMTLASSAGWSVSGGPGVAPASAMKKLVWSETRLKGGQRYNAELPQPPTDNGPFQDLGRRPPFRLNGQPRWSVPLPEETDYRDVRVIAYRIPAAEAVAPTPVVTASAGTPDAAVLRDGLYKAAFVLPINESAEPWLRYDFGAPVTIRSLRLAIAWPEDKASPMPEGTIEASDDGVAYRKLQELPLRSTVSGPPLYTLSLPETRARYFRIVLKPGSGFSFPGLPLRDIREFRITEADLSPIARPNRYEAKAAFAVLHDYDAAATQAVAADSVVAVDSVIDVTHRLNTDGRFDWTPPAGDWTVIRFGTSLTGQINAPATLAGTGFEVDKYSVAEVRDYLEHYYGSVFAELDGLTGKRGLRALLVDSFEAGQANWTPAMLDEFRKRRGYDATPWLPVLANRIVGSAQDSDRFLWDFRRTLADMLAENHYGTIAEYAKAHGLGYYGEAMGVDLPTTGDGLQAKRYPTIPMAEFWQVAPDQPSLPNHIADVREAASAAHVYGQNIVATESFTGFPLPTTPAPYTTTPWMLKPLADRFMALGVNQFVIHTAVHQPIEKAPGFTLSIFGQYFSRHETWGEMARGWTDYLARASSLLQQGRYAADIAYFYGEGAAVTVPGGAITDPAIPTGYAYDFVNRDMLLQDFKVDDGELLAPSGVRYKLLVLPATLREISLPLLQRLDALVRAGAVLVGPRPRAAAGLQASDAEVDALARKLWGELDGKTRVSRNHGAGRVYWSATLDDVLAKEKLAPDLRFSGAGSERIVAIHRHLDDGEVYFVANQANVAVDIEADLRVANRDPELWYPDDGRRVSAAFRQSDGRTRVPLRLAPYESTFIVLRAATTQIERRVDTKPSTVLATLDGSWTLSFAKDRGAPERIDLPSLTSWSEHSDPGVRYYAGTATYRRNLVLDTLPSQDRLLLDLGTVHELAHVRVNGVDVGIAWKPPYRVDIGKALKPGSNTLEIEVANLWPNRFVGDLQPDAKRQYTFSTFDLYAPLLAKLPFTAETPLQPSGLLGPVRLITE